MLTVSYDLSRLTQTKRQDHVLARKIHEKIEMHVHTHDVSARFSPSKEKKWICMLVYGHKLVRVMSVKRKLDGIKEEITQDFFWAKRGK